MKDFSFELAKRHDDPDIRRLLAKNPVPGNVAVTYEREPDYFLGCGTMGQFWQVLVARHNPTGEIVGLACRATRPLFVNGKIEEVGYLGQLRVDRRFRGRWVVALVRLARQLHGDGRVGGYITTITEENAVAQGVLVDHPRRNHPIYRQVGQLCTLALILRRSKPFRSSPYEICRGSEANPSEIVSFLRSQGPNKQFFPAYTQQDFRDNVTTLGFKFDDFVVARRNGKIVGVIGLWDQSEYKQTVVQAYSGALRFVRPFYNVRARLTWAQPLPPPGQAINHAYASFICVENNGPEVFSALLRHVYNEAVRRGYAYLLVGLDSRDQLLPVAQRYPHITYLSRLYTVCWDEEGEFHARLDGRIPYVEIAAL